AISYLDRTDLAHVKPEGASFDDLGRGDVEGKRNFGEVSDSQASKSIEMLKSISSTGYLRKRLPQELVVFQGGLLSSAQPTSTESLTMTSLVAETAMTALSTGTVGMDVRTKAKMQGYEGDSCGECGNYTLVRNGTCMKCNTCGGTSGCS
ncbi:MAG: vitamin B12-dependent ribonucleotide reductase, partial [Rhodobacteraceae bacterium]|nr:vitamin B12-dependent ribonucleotide reductase [Paracoccaceae bacterium]